MTKEEELDWLCRLRSEIYVYMPQEWIKKMDEALTQSIKALEQEPCDDAISRNDMLDAVGHGTTYTSLEVQKIINVLPSVNPVPCDDVVSRQAALDTEYQIKEINGIEYVMLSEVQMKMRKLPSVRPQEPKTGHWIAVVDKWGDIVTTVNGYKCSECGEFDGFRDKFCPNCGCRMVEPQESEKQPLSEEIVEHYRKLAEHYDRR